MTFVYLLVNPDGSASIQKLSSHKFPPHWKTYKLKEGYSFSIITSSPKCYDSAHVHVLMKLGFEPNPKEMIGIGSIAVYPCTKYILEMFNKQLLE